MQEPPSPSWLKGVPETHCSAAALPYVICSTYGISLQKLLSYSAVAFIACTQNEMQIQTHGSNMQQVQNTGVSVPETECN